MAFLQLPGSPGGYLSGPIIPCKGDALQWGGEARQIQKIPAVANSREEKYKMLRQHRTIPALRLKHRSGSCGTASALPKCLIMSSCGTRIVLRGQKPLALCDRCPCFGSLFPPLAALTFAASSITCAFGLASAAPRSPYRHLELCGIALKKKKPNTIAATGSQERLSSLHMIQCYCIKSIRAHCSTQRMHQHNLK